MQKALLNKSNLTCHKKLAWIALLAFIVLSLALTPARAAEQPDINLDYQVKAAMLYKFLGYTEWPENNFQDAHSPYRIWVLGTNILSDELIAVVAGRAVNGRPIEVYSTSNVDHIINANMVFVARNMEIFLPKLARAAEQYSFMIVTENEQGLKPESTINLRLVDRRIGFDISLQSAKKNNLKLSSRLFPVALSVEEEAHK